MTRVGLEEDEQVTELMVAAAAPRARKTRLVLPAALAIGIALSFFLLVIAARHVYGGNSDDATLVLEGQSLAAGHLTLWGWALSIDSFWTTDAPFYGIGVLLFGVRPALLNILPALIAEVVVLTGALVVCNRRRDLPACIGVGVVIVLLAVPSPDFAYFFLQSGWHAVTALWCILAFAGVSRVGSRWALVGSVVLLAAGLLGDLLTLTLGLAPILAAGLIAVGRERRWRAGGRYLVAATGGVGLALLARAVALAIGTYSIGSRSVLATTTQMLANAKSIPNRLFGFYGLGGIVNHLSTAPALIRWARFAVCAVVVWATVMAIVAIVRGIAGRPARPPAAEDWRVDDLLLLGMFGGFGSFILFATVSDFSLARYLVPGFIFSALLAGRVVARFVRQHRLTGARYLAAAALVMSLAVVDFATNTLGDAAPQKATQLSSFLVQHDLREGIGDYWSSSLVTVESSGAVAVRPVDLGPAGTLVRYDKQSTAAWYAGRAFQFFVCDTADDWHNVTAAAATKTFGEPAINYKVGTYEVLVWPHPVHISVGD